MVVDLPLNAMPVPGSQAHIEVADLTLNTSVPWSDSVSQSSVLRSNLGLGYSCVQLLAGFWLSRATGSTQ